MARDLPTFDPWMEATTDAASKIEIDGDPILFEEDGAATALFVRANQIQRSTRAMNVWSTQSAIAGTESATGNLATAPAELPVRHLCYRHVTTGDATELRGARLQGTTATYDTSIVPFQPRSVSAHPSLISKDGTLFLLFSQESDRILKSLDGVAASQKPFEFSGGGTDVSTVSLVKNADTPTTAEYKGFIYMAFRDATTNVLNVIRTSNGVRWTVDPSFPRGQPPITSSTPPTLIKTHVFLYLAYGQTDGTPPGRLQMIARDEIGWDSQGGTPQGATTTLLGPPAFYFEEEPKLLHAAIRGPGNTLMVSKAVLPG